MKRKSLITAFLFWSVLLGGARQGQASAGPIAIPVELDLSNVTITSELSVTAATLPVKAFSSKPVVIPVQVKSSGPTIDSTGLKVEMVYQITDSAGTAIGGINTSPVQLQRTIQANVLGGATFIDATTLAAIQPGQHLKYYFHVKQGAADLFLSPAAPAGGTRALPSDSYDVTFMDTIQFPVNSSGGRFSAPDTQAVDGKTGVLFDPAAISGAGTLTIHQENINAVPRGPLGLAPVAVYSFTLDGASLQRTARIMLSYPANLDGTVGDARLNPKDLAPYWYENPYGWRILSRPDIDTLMHTVTGISTHFSMFALFPTGPVSAATLRPQERIITPNGDHVNDTADFNGLFPGDEVHIFDIRGRRVRTINAPPYSWDGRDDAGKIVESGIYIFQYTSQGERASGVIMVAK